jgi:hypothetical protein
VPLALAGAGKVAGSVLRKAPGAQAGVQEATQRALGPGAANTMRPVPPSRPLWQRVDQAGSPISVGTGRLKLLANEMDEALKADKFASPQTKRLVSRLQKLAGGSEGGVPYIPLREFRQNMQSLGAELGQQKGAAKGLAKKAYKAMWEELDDAVKGAEQAGNPTGSLLRQAVDATKREQARDTLARWYSQSTTYASGQRQINLDSLMTKLERNKDLMQRWLPKDEYQEILDVVKDYAGKTPRIPSTTEPVGNASRLLSALGPDQVADMLSSRPGRRAVRLMVEQGPAIQYGLITPAAQLAGRAVLTPPQAEAGPSLGGFGFQAPGSPALRQNLREQLPPAPPRGDLTGGLGQGLGPMLQGLPF